MLILSIPHLISDDFLKNTQRWTENMCVYVHACVCVCVCEWERERGGQKTIYDCNFVSRLYTCRQNYYTYEERINKILKKKLYRVYNECCYNLHLSPDFITMTKSVKTRLTEHVICRKIKECMQNFGRKRE